MWLTSASELAPDQWVPSLITNLTGMQGILILVYTAGIMFVLRFFGGALAHKFSPFGLMTICAVLTAGRSLLAGFGHHPRWCIRKLPRSSALARRSSGP